MDLRDVLEDFCKYKCREETCANWGTCVVMQFVEEVESIESLNQRHRKQS